jgi:hypothetical protein
LVKTTPAPAGESHRRVPLVTWLAPFALTAAAIAIWVNLQQRAPIVMPSIAPPPAIALRTEPPSPQEAQREAQRSPSFVAPRVKTRPLSSSTVAAAQPTPAGNDMRAAAEPREAAPANVNPPTAPAATPGPPPTLAETLSTTDSMSVQPRAQQRAGAPLAMAKSLAAGSVREITSPDALYRWRLTDAPGMVERSHDGGMTWEAQATGSTTRLAAGSSPALAVCWVVGSNGTILLSTDGRSWMQVPFPESVDLISVRASDDRAASIVTRDGRRFATADRGGHWAPQ